MLSIILFHFVPKTTSNEIKKAPQKETAPQWTPRTLRGATDTLPTESHLFEYLLNRVMSFARVFGFSRIEPSLLEEARLFSKGMGSKVADQVLYSWPQASGPMVALRPEYTMSVIRSFMHHNLDAIQPTWKLYYHGPVFRKESASAGHAQQLHQFGYEVLGDRHPIVDAQLITLAYKLYTEAGLPISLSVNCIGDHECRPQYTNHLQEYLRSRRQTLCDACKQSISVNPYRIFLCTEAGCREVADSSQPVVDWLCTGCREHFVKVLEFLDELEIPYLLNPKLFRPHEYYSRTLFELTYDNGVGESIQLAAGGRYDGLVESVGGRPTPAIGFSGFIEQSVAVFKKHGIQLPLHERPAVFLAQLGNESRKISLRIFEELRKAGISVADRFSMDGLSGQLDAAAKLNVRFTIILGQKELLDKTVIIRDMESGIQEVVDLAKVTTEVRKRIERSTEQVYRANAVVSHQGLEQHDAFVQADNRQSTLFQ